MVTPVEGVVTLAEDVVNMVGEVVVALIVEVLVILPVIVRVPRSVIDVRGPDISPGIVDGNLEQFFRQKTAEGGVEVW